MRPFVATAVLLSGVLAPLGVAPVPAATATAAAPAPDQLVVTGHGKGHGVGASIAGFANRAAAGQTWPQMLDFYLPGTTDQSLPADASIRVGLLATSGGDGGWVRLAGGGGDPCTPPPWSPVDVTAGADVNAHVPADQYVAVTHSSGTNVVEQRTADGQVVQRWQTANDVQVSDPANDLVRVLDLSSPCDDRYRDFVVVHWSDHATADPTDDRLWVVNRVNLEAYVWGIAEAPDSLPPEAQAALAVTARTYAEDKVEGSRFKVDGFDISSSSGFLPPGYPGATQLYLGFDAERPNLRAAAQATAGDIRTYGTEGAVLAAYSANAGPITADPRVEFGFPSPVAYLTQRADPFYRPDVDADWTQSYRPDVAGALLAAGVGDVSGYAVQTRTDAGRPSAITVFGTAGTATLSAPVFRSRLGLPSDFVDVPVVRLAGTDRTGTAAAISREAHPGKTQTVLVANGTDAHLVDSLVAAPLAAVRGAALLLTAADRLSDETEAEIQRLQASDAVVLGGVDAVPDAVVVRLRQLGLTVTRLAGADRYDTAARVARALGGRRPDCVVASGEPGHLVDALAAAGPAAALGRPVLLVQAGGVPAPTQSALSTLGTTHVIVAGGPDAVSDGVLQQLPSPTRVAAATRWQTATALADRFTPLLDAAGPGLRRVALASGDDDHLADALAGGTLGAVTLLGPSTGVGPDAHTWLGLHRLAVGRLTLLGGPPAVSTDAAQDATVFLDSW